MPLVRCNTVYGGTSLFETPPPMQRMRNAIYLPDYYGGIASGLYSQEQTFVPEAAFYRGVPTLGLAEGQEIALNIRPRARYDEQTCLYIGTPHPHFGHFLLLTFSRLWAYRRLVQELPNLKILYKGTAPIEMYFEIDYYQKLFGILGIDQSRFIMFDEPTIIGSIIVPAPSLVENHCIHREFSHFFRRMGQDFAAHVPVSKSDRPLYLTKHRLATGVTCVRNEIDMVERLERAGVEIVAPEELSLAQQIALMRDRSIITGFVGSQFHMGAFAPSNRYLILSHEMRIWSNQQLIDMAGSNNAVHMYPLDDISFIAAPDERFAMNMTLHQPQKTAEELLRFFEPFGRIPTQRNVWENGDDSADIRTRTERPLGRNLALGRPARQSSVSEWSIGDSIEQDAGGAVNGRLAGEHQFHTDYDAEPWWLVDLEGEFYVNGIVVYNVDDPLQERANGLGLSVSSNGSDWSEMFVHDGETPFGGKMGEPLVWIADRPVQCRFVRVTLPRENYLHLDQVEVFGRDPDELDAV